MHIPLSINLLLILALPGIIQGDTVRSISHFEGMQAARISVVIGGPLDIDGGPALRLFAGDIERAKRFESTMREVVASMLCKCGIRLDDRVDDEVTIRVFGRPERLTESNSSYIFLVEVGVFNSLQAEERGLNKFSDLRPVIGTVGDQGLETALLDSATTIISEQLGECSKSK